MLCYREPTWLPWHHMKTSNWPKSTGISYNYCSLGSCHAIFASISMIRFQNPRCKPKMHFHLFPLFSKFETDSFLQQKNETLRVKFCTILTFCGYHSTPLKLAGHKNYLIFNLLRRKKNLFLTRYEWKPNVYTVQLLPTTIAYNDLVVTGRID